MRKLDILVPQYNEDIKVIKNLLDSIEIQQNVDFQDINVIICNDGNEKTYLPQDFLNSYSFNIQYYKEQHEGVSATRNKCLARSNADYVMFCDADDMFYSACGLYILFREFNDIFDVLVSCFIEETRDILGTPVYINHNIDSVFVHGKVFRRQYLIDNNIKWNHNLTIHEDSYFNILCQKMTNNIKYCPTSFYLWKWRDNSVCRHDPKYILKTYNNMLDSNTALVNEFLSRDKKKEAMFYVTTMIYDAYFTLNKDEWINQENQCYRNSVEDRFKKYYSDFKELFDYISTEERNQIIIGLKNRMYSEGLILEHITFDDWIKNF